jgi:uncharacterized protein (TIGR01370 family)
MQRMAHFCTVAAATLAAAAWPLPGAHARADARERWAVCYTNRPAAADLAAYDVVVLDPHLHPPLGPLIERNRTVLAYLSLTQLHRDRAHFSTLRRAGVVLEAHPIWSDAHYLDFRRPEWSRLVLESLVPEALEQGFTGLFLDTLDDAELLEAQDPARHRGMTAAAVRLVRAIRHQYPQAVLMVNRGYAVVPEIAGSIDILLGESVITTFDAGTRDYRRVTDAGAKWQIDRLRDARRINPGLKLFTLDYWDPADLEGVRRIYREQRDQGFVPYVSTPELDALVEEPR